MRSAQNGIIVSALLAAAMAPAAAAVPLTHVIIIMQENRSFDHYFGTYPGADGYPQGLCVPIDPANPNGGCVAPFHDVFDENAGGPHTSSAGQADLADGVTAAAMNGFVAQQMLGSRANCKGDNPGCSGPREGAARHDTMGYHNATELPNYWAYAQHFVLQDHMFEGQRSWSVPAHLDLVSEWVARCAVDTEPQTCVTAASAAPPSPHVTYPWESLFQFLDVHGVSWKYYLGEGAEPDCDDGEMTCAPQNQLSHVASIWNPAPSFNYVRRRGGNYLVVHNPPAAQFLADIAKGQLPQVSWVVPAQDYSEHPPGGVTAGMEYVTSLVNAVMQSPYWANTAIFISWDDWGGFYDHVLPPNVDANSGRTPVEGFGLRVPGLLVSAYARAGYIDHGVLSADSYATFIEDLFMNGARLDPAAVGNVEYRPDIRDSITQVTYLDGTTAPVARLMDEFDFMQSPLPPLVLSTHIPTHIQVACRGAHGGTTQPCTQPQVVISWVSVAGPQVPGPFTYHVHRNGMELPQCVGSGTSCVDTPAPGAYAYRAYSVDGRGVASPLSAASVAMLPGS